MGRLVSSLSKMILILAPCVLVLASCSSQFAASMRKVTYPPDFAYIEQGKLRSDMGRLAQQMRLLDQALIEQNSLHDQTSVDAERQRQKVLATLRNMGRIATELKAGNTGANHPFMQDHMQDFVAKVDKAKVAASLEQPRYFFAGKISGGCTNCHKVNR
jgi:hypothetical protein